MSKVKRIEENISYECKLCKETFIDRLKVRNHVKNVHKLERKLLNMNRNRINRRIGVMGLVKRHSDWVDNV